MITILKKIDFKLFGIISSFLSVIYLMSFIKIFYLKFNKVAYAHLSWKYVIINVFLFESLIILIVSILIILITKWLIKIKLKYFKIFGIHFLISLAIGFIIFGLWIFLNFSLDKLHPEYNLTHFIRGFFGNIKELSLLYFSIVAISYSYYYLKEKERVVLEKTQLQDQLNTTKLNLLKSNLHPHFIFNTLNSISSLTETNPKQAQNTIGDLGNLLRNLLDLKDENLISLNQELNILNSYLNIIKVRFSDHFILRKDISNLILDAKIPSMLLQPIIENSIKHGYSFNNTDLSIWLNIKKENNSLVISIENNGKPLEKKINNSQNGIGIKNTIERLKATYQNEYTFSMKNKKNKNGVITYITIPYIT